MFTDLSEVVAVARLPFGENVPRKFSGLFEVGTTGFDPHALIEDDTFRCGRFSPNDRKVNFVRNQQLVPQDEYRSAEDAWTLWHGGASMVFYGLQRYHAGVAQICQVIADALGLPVHANAYWTPAGNQGFPLHADPDSVIVIQKIGAKRWLIFSPKAASLEDADGLSWVHTDGRTREIAPPDQAAFLIDLRPGDVMWLPRGWGHYAIAADGGESFHVSLGILHPEINSDGIARLHPTYPRR
jgi:ribosomal protein L16 Arg81 hydroxylase